MKCALSIIDKNNNPSVSECNMIFNLGMKLMSGEESVGISFPVFLMVADVYRSFSNVLKFNGSTITEQEMRRNLVENEVPNRYDDESIKSI